MRISLYERLKQQQLSYLYELKKINNLVRKDNYSLEYLRESFKRSDFCVYYENYEEATIELFDTVSDFGCVFRDNGLDSLISAAISSHCELTLDSFLDYLQFYKTLFSINIKFSINNNITQIKRIIDYDCDKLGYTFIKKDDLALYDVMLKNPEAESVALIVEKNTSNKIYEYLTIRPNMIEEKRKCLKSLADDVEKDLKKYKDIYEFGKVKQFIQCIRHTKDEPKKEFPFYYKNEEYWLDKTFEMIIGIIAFTKTKETVDEIVRLENENRSTL